MDSEELTYWQVSFPLWKAKIGIVAIEVTMLTLILIIILLLPGAFLPVALKVIFTSEELLDMGVYQEGLQSFEMAPQKPRTSSKGCPAHALNSMPR